MNFCIPYRVGNTLTRDHQNWPTLTRVQLTKFFPDISPSQYDRFWEAEITLKQLLAMAWRVKEFKFTGSISVTLVETGGSNNHYLGNTTLDGTIYLLDNANNIATSELGLISGVYGGSPYPRQYFKSLVNSGFGIPNAGAFITSIWATTVNGGTNLSGVENQDLRVMGDAILYDPSTKLFTIPAQGLTRNGAGSGDLFSSSYLHAFLTCQRNPGTGLSGTAPFGPFTPITCTVRTGIAPDFILPMQLVWAPTGETPGSGISGTASGSCLLEAKKFWPHKNKSGQACYDVDTGAQINNPFG